MTWRRVAAGWFKFSMPARHAQPKDTDASEDQPGQPGCYLCWAGQSCSLDDSKLAESSAHAHNRLRSGDGEMFQGHLVLNEAWTCSTGNRCVVIDHLAAQSEGARMVLLYRKFA